MQFCDRFVVISEKGNNAVIPPKKGNIADKQKGNNIDTEYLRNGCIFLAAIFLGWQGRSTRIFRDPARPPRTPSSGSGSNFVEKNVKNCTFGASGCPPGLPEVVGGGEFQCWELRTLPNQVTTKKNFKPWEKFPTFCVDVIPSPLSSYGVSTLFPLPGSTYTRVYTVRVFTNFD